jgi:formamidopyrimidine-DNA glycosylase
VPELPEVETIVCDLRLLLTGETIGAVDILWERTIGAPAPAEFAAQLVGQRIGSVDRRGKFVVLHLEQGDLLVHLRMTGQLLVTAADEEPDRRHLRVALQLGNRRLLFVDTRKFGRMYLVQDASSILGDLGVEPLDASFTSGYLAGCLQGRRAPIKSLLLNQRLVAGIGNIYADEVLFAAGVSPSRRACTLGQAEVEALHLAIGRELRRGIRNRGTTISDYRDANGCPGEHHEFLQAYGRSGQPCLRCGAEIVRSRVGGRSSYYCPCCQR